MMPSAPTLICYRPITDQLMELKAASVQALRCLLHLVADAPMHAKQLLTSTVTPGNAANAAGSTQSAVSAVLDRCLHSPEVAERTTSRALLRTFCKASPEGQQALLAEASLGSGGCAPLQS